MWQPLGIANEATAIQAHRTPRRTDFRGSFHCLGRAVKGRIQFHPRARRAGLTPIPILPVADSEDPPTLFAEAGWCRRERVAEFARTSANAAPMSSGAAWVSLP